jgi:5-formyltetrahydrofolate cyclo-ligase
MELDRDEKERLRQEILRRRSQLAIEEREQASRKIVQEILRSKQFQEAEIIFAYIPFRDEVDISALIEECWRMDKQIFVPKADKASQSMAFYRIESWSDLEKGNYGIMEPKRSCLSHTNEKIDLMIVPGVAFDRKRNRIGYGAGYYDRYLSRLNHKPFLLAPAYSLQIVPKIPTEPWDQPLDAIITEAEWIY